MSDFEHPGAFREGEKKQRKHQEEGLDLKESKDHLRFFDEKKREIISSRSREYASRLKEKISTTYSLSELKGLVQEAKKEGILSSQEYSDWSEIIAEKEGLRNPDISFLPQIDPSKLLGGPHPWVHHLEQSRLGQNLIIDSLGFLYGFIIQGGAILGYIFLRLLLDLLLLPFDIVSSFFSRSSPR